MVEIQYLELDDLVEQDRDHIQRLLFSPNAENPCKQVEFPFAVCLPEWPLCADGAGSGSVCVHDAACSPTGVQSPEAEERIQQHNNNNVASNHIPPTSFHHQQQHHGLQHTAPAFKPNDLNKYNHQPINMPRQPSHPHMFNAQPVMYHPSLQQFRFAPAQFQQPPPNTNVDMSAAHMFSVPLMTHMPMPGHIPRAQYMQNNLQGYPIMSPNTSQAYIMPPQFHPSQLSGGKGRSVHTKPRVPYNNVPNFDRYRNPPRTTSSRASTATTDERSNSSSPNDHKVQNHHAKLIASEEPLAASSPIEHATPDVASNNIDNTDISTTGTEIAQNGPVERCEETPSREVGENKEESIIMEQSRPDEVGLVDATCVIDEQAVVETPLEAEQIIETDNIDNDAEERVDIKPETEGTQPNDEIEQSEAAQPDTHVLDSNDVGAVEEGTEDEQKQSTDENETPPTPQLPSPTETGEKKEGGKTWASLFRNDTAIVTTISDWNTNTSGTASRTTADNSNTSNTVNGTLILNTEDSHADVVKPEDDPMAPAVKDCLVRHLQHRGGGIQQIGLYNPGNWCYMNASLQALIACPPFFHLLKSLQKLAHRSPTCTPILDALGKLVCDPAEVGRRGGGKRAGDKAIDAPYLRRMAISLRQDSFKGRQEDAQEFLILLMQAIHEEMLAILSLGRNKPVSPPVEEKPNLNDSDEWQQVGPNRKTAITRQTTVSQTPLSDLFVFHKRYTLKRGAESKDTANIEPFYMMPLEINHSSIVDLDTAMQQTFRAETIDMKSERSKNEIYATRKPMLQDLPPVLILHLKYFDFATEGTKKLQKEIKYAVDLKIRPDILSDMKTNHPALRKYKLFAVVFHVGEQAAGGHYIADVFHGHGWMEMDDQNVFSVTEESVLKAIYPRTPYLLFYRRCDLMAQVPRAHRLSASPAH